MFLLQKIEAVCMHHLVIIQNLENSVCHLLLKHRGSISCNCLYFAALIQLLAISPCSEYFDICQEGRIGGVSGRGTGRGTRGWGPVGRPHYTAHVVHPLLCFFRILCQKVFKKTSLFQFILPIFYLSHFLIDESTEEEAA